MFKNPWFTLILGLMVGLAVGYVLAEMQPVPPARAMAARQVADPGDDLPEGHPPIGAESGDRSAQEARSRELQQLIEKSPDNPRLMVALANLHFDSEDWAKARTWYERALDTGLESPDVVTDLAVVHRNLKEPERALELLERAISLAPDHWQAWHNKVVILHFDLHRHEDAERAFDRLRQIKETNPGVPDLSGLEKQLRGG